MGVGSTDGLPGFRVGLGAGLKADDEIGVGERVGDGVGVEVIRGVGEGTKFSSSRSAGSGVTAADPPPHATNPSIKYGHLGPRRVAQLPNGRQGM